MTWVGAPTIYYGDEAGVCGFTDPDNRRTYPWGNENQELLNFHKEMIRIHKEHPALRTGSLNILSWDENVLAYGRFLGEDRIVAIINNRSELTEVTVPVWQVEVPMKCRMKRLIYSYSDGYTIEDEEYLVDDGEVVVNMGAHSALILGIKSLRLIKITWKKIMENITIISFALSVIIDEKARRRKWVKKHMVMCGYPAGIRI